MCRFNCGFLVVGFVAVFAVSITGSGVIHAQDADVKASTTVPDGVGQLAPVFVDGKIVEELQ
ncbi:MAG: hypothetical protein KY475_12915, partial [Planctomycetes bacterium]|nr:hypothetical protein [Planctomycetota bacterium]